MIFKPLSLGFIGGSIDSAVGAVHNIASQMDNRWQLTAGCFSTDQGMNHETASQWGLNDDQLYSNWPEMLSAEQGKLDAVVVLTPTPSHAEIVLAAIGLGYPVICEKALAISSERLVNPNYS